MNYLLFSATKKCEKHKNFEAFFCIYEIHRLTEHIKIIVQLRYNISNFFMYKECKILKTYNLCS